MGFLTNDPLDPAALSRVVATPDRGGVVVFEGRVRNHHGSREVVRLEYSAYPAMAEDEAARVLAEAAERWPVVVAAGHRVGVLEVGAIAVVVAAAGAHREEAFDACRWTIAEIKRRVPVWKREHYADGTSDWVDPSHGGGAPPP